MDLLNYKESFLNPLLKELVALIYLCATLVFLVARTRLGGELQKITGLLATTSLFGTLALAFRWRGDKLVAWKWGESLLFLLFAIVALIIAIRVSTRLKEATRIFRGGI
ncbi:MAG: hypothetical protein AB1500_07950 [Bacillota bacterium]